MSSNSFVSYLRASTTKQEASGLGIEGQRAAVARFVGDRRLVHEFVEIESGAKNDRPQLMAALALAKRTKSTLVIAKIDRLGRNVALVSGLMESGVDFVCCDAPHASRLTLHILVAMAEHERQMISERTKAALQAKKARGEQLGNPTNLAEAQAIGRGVIKDRVDAHTGRVIPHIREIVAGGVRSVHAVADTLNARGITTRSGSRWYGASVLGLVKRAGYDGLGAMTKND